MSSIDLIRQDKGLTVKELFTRADIAKSTYYQIIDGHKNVSDTVLNKLGRVLNIPALKTLHLIDRLYKSKLNVSDLVLPDTIPGRIRELLYKKHPLFLKDKSEYNGLNKRTQ